MAVPISLWAISLCFCLSRTTWAFHRTLTRLSSIGNQVRPGQRAPGSLITRLLSSRSDFSSKYRSLHPMRIERTDDDGCDTIIIHPALGSHSATLVVLHGLGDSCNGFEDVAAMLHQSMPHLKIILPTAKANPVTLNGGMRMNSWYDIVGLDDRAGERCDGIEDSVRRVRSYLHAENEKGLPYARMALAGFSQGGALSLYTGLQLPIENKLAGIAVMSGYLPGADKFHLTEGMADVPVLHCHGKSDPVVIHQWALKTKDFLLSQGLTSHRLLSYDNVMHTVTPTIIQEVKKFLSDILPFDAAIVMKPKPPKEMSIKELKEAIREAGMTSQTKGFAEKYEYVNLLEGYFKTVGITYDN